jgi:hypothetical protein
MHPGEEAMTDAENSLRAVSDELLRELDRLAALEAEKRTLHPGEARAVELSNQAHRLAEKILATTGVEKELAQGGHLAIHVALPDAPQHSIDETPRALHAILDDWRAAERQAASAATQAERDEFRRQSEAFRDEYREVFDRLDAQERGRKH